MLSSSTIWISLFCYICFLAAMAFYVVSKEKNISEKQLFTPKIPWPVLVMTYVASLMSVWVFFAGPGAYYRGGIGYWLSELSYIPLFPIIAHFTMNKVWLLNKVNNDNFVTPADFYAERFPSKTLRVILGLLFLLTSFPYISSVLMAVGQAAQFATDGDISYKLAVLVAGIGTTIFVSIGGTKSAAMADTIQGLIFISLLWAIVGICVGIGFPQNGLNPIEVLQEKAPAFFSYPGPDAWVSYGSRFGYPFSCAIGWTIMLPHVFVRSGYFGDGLKAQRRLFYFAPVLQAIVWTGTMGIGLLGLAFFQNLANSQTELLVPYLITNVVSTASPYLAYVLMIGFFVGTCAVGISTANAFLSVSASIISIDFIRKTFNINIACEKKSIVNRTIIFIIGTFSTILALYPPDLIFTLIMFAIAIVMPLFPILVFAIYWKKSTTQGAISASIVGAVIVLLTYFVFDLGNTWYGAFGLIGSAVTMYVVSLFTKDSSTTADKFYADLEKAHKKYYLA